MCEIFEDIGRFEEMLVFVRADFRMLDFSEVVEQQTDIEGVLVAVRKTVWTNGAVQWAFLTFGCFLLIFSTDLGELENLKFPN